MIKLNNGFGRRASIVAIMERTGKTFEELDRLSTWELIWKEKDLEMGLAV